MDALITLIATRCEYDPLLDILTLKLRPFRPCKVGELDDEDQVMVNNAVEFFGQRSEKLQTVVPLMIRFHRLQEWPQHASYWLTTSMHPFKLVVHDLDLDTPNLALVFATAYRHYVQGKPLA